MQDRQDTIAAIATAPGAGAIGIVRMSGPQSLPIARQISATEPRPRHAHFCDFRDEQDRIIDQGLLLYFPAPNSFTGEDMVEFQGHGGDVVLNILLKRLLDLGARLARPGEFSERAYMNDKMDLVQAEAIADLISSASERAARSAASSLEGEFSRAIHDLVQQIISLRVMIESALDFPEEEIDFIDAREVNAKLDAVRASVEELLSFAEAGRRLRSGLRVAIIGRPNVGKSSLLNQLVRLERAIVTEIAGTTRDTVEETVMLNGCPVTIIDTAGLRESDDPVEQEGIKRSREALSRADLIMLVTDQLDEDLSMMMGEVNKTDTSLMIVHNKIDASGIRAESITRDGTRHVFVSARTGEGMDLLREALAERAGAADAGEHVILARQRHIDALTVARDRLASGDHVFTLSRSAELLAEELRKAQEALGTITGEFHNDELLGEIFSTFCIGK